MDRQDTLYGREQYELQESQDGPLKSLAKRAEATVFSSIARLFNGIYPGRNDGPIIISGSPRGGTTWIAESIARMYGSARVLWEPLQDGNFEKQPLRLSKRPYIDESSADTRIDAFFERLLHGTMVNRHTLRLNKQPGHRWSLFRNQRLVIKFVRGNGVVGYLQRRFDLPKPLVIVRHPCAVVSSQLHMGQWEDHPYVADQLYEAFPRIRDVVDRSASLHERLAVTWAADVLNARLAGDDVQIIHYEDVVVNRLEALRPILREWGWDELHEEMERYLDRPSSSHKAWTQLQSTEAKLGRWKKDLNEDMITDILNVVHRMGVEEYGTNALPEFLTHSKS